MSVYKREWQKFDVERLSLKL